MQNTKLQDHKPLILGYPDTSVNLTKFYERSYRQVVVRAARARHRTMTELSLVLPILELQRDCSSARKKITMLQLHTYIRFYAHSISWLLFSSETS